MISSSHNYHFDQDAADKACEFFPLYLRHVEGRFAGKPFRLMDWQRKIVADLFGWKRDDGTRKFRTAYIEIPRKNGKSTFAAGIALYLLLCDREPGAQIFSAASTRDQAYLVYRMAMEMIRQSPKMSAMVKIRDSKKTTFLKRDNSFYKAVAAEAGPLHGLNAHGIIFDELHTQPNRDLWDVLTTSTGARSQPLTVAITTAGHDRSSICWELHEKAAAQIKGEAHDDSFYPVLFAADERDDWTDPKVWAKANPSLNEGVSLAYLEQECARALESPSYENTFRNLHLNQWTAQAVRWLQMHLWDACFVEEWPDLTGCECWGGLDLASSRDVNAFVLVFTHGGRFYLLPRFWIPEHSLDKRGEQDRRMIDNWAERGFVKRTPGTRIDLRTIARDVAELNRRYNVNQIAYDPWNAQGILEFLVEEGLKEAQLVEFRQTMNNFAYPTKRFEELMASRELAHDGHPVLRWMAENVAVKRDVADNIRPDKEASADKIDGIVASIMALARAIHGERPRRESVYAKRGVLSL